MTGSEIRVDGGYCAIWRPDLSKLDWLCFNELNALRHNSSFFSMSTTSGAGQAQPPSKTYDFTKRKRWADLLLTELVDNIPFILSVAGKILYCGNAVTELLGWKDVELLDINFMQLVDCAFVYLKFFGYLPWLIFLVYISQRPGTLSVRIQPVTAD